MYYINIYLFKLNVHTNAFNDTGTKVHSNHTGCKSSWLNFSKGQEENQNPLDASLGPLCSEIVEDGLITCSVENVALSYFQDEGWQGGHYETSILTTLFSLLFWDILFLSDTETHKAVFQHPFQGDFFMRRVSCIHFQIDRSILALSFFMNLAKTPANSAYSKY
jgi:hypothetical protein